MELEEVHSAHASLDTRPVLQQLRRMVRGRELDVVVVWRFDRLARGYLDDAAFTREAMQMGVRVESATEKIPDGPMGNVIRAVIATQAEQEWESIRHRAMSGTRKRIESGKYHTGKRPPFWYMFSDSRKSRVVPDPVTSPIVVRIFVMVADGMSCHAVARILTEEGIPSPTGKLYWYFEVVRKIILNPLYQGIAIAYRTREESVVTTHPVSGERISKKVVVPGEQKILPEGTAVALVTPELAQ